MYDSGVHGHRRLSAVSEQRIRSHWLDWTLPLSRLTYRLYIPELNDNVAGAFPIHLPKPAPCRKIVPYRRSSRHALWGELTYSSFHLHPNLCVS